MIDIVLRGNERDMLGTLGQRALILRKDLDYSQRDVVDYLKSHGVDIDYSHYSRIENDKALPSIPVLIAMVKVLNCTSDYLLLISDEAHARDDTNDVFVTPEANEAGSIIDTLDDDMRQHVLATAKVIQSIDTERKELHAELVELLSEQISLLSGKKRQQATALLARLS